MGRSIEMARLFYTLEMETKGFQQDLDKSERALGRLATFIEKNPAPAFIGLGTAVAAVAVQATSMAGEVDAAIRKVTQRVPDGTKAFDQMRQLAKDLSIEFGLAQTEVVGVMQAIADGGISSARDLEEATRAVVLAQKASGRSFEEIVKALDTSLDAFGLSASDSQQILADLLATAKGSTNLGDLGTVLAKVGPVAKAAGVDFQTTVAAIAAMQTQVTDTKGQVTLFKNVLEKDGVKGLEAYADAVRPAGDALKAMQQAADENNRTLGSLQEQLKARFSAAMVDLGTTILPLATSAMQAFVDVLTFFSDDARSAQAAGQIAAIRTEVQQLGAEAGKNNPAVEKLATTLKALGGDLRTLDFKKNLETIPTQKLLELQQDWQLVADKTDRASFRMAEAKAALQAIEKELAKRPLESFRKDTDQATASVTKSLPPLKDYAKTSKELSEVEKQAAEDRKRLADRTATLVEINNILADKSLRYLDHAKAALKKLADEMLGAGATTDQVNGLLGKLFARVEALEKKQIEKPFKAAVLTGEALEQAVKGVNAAVDETLEKQPKVKVNFDLIKDEVFAIAEEALRAAEQFGLINGDAYQTLGYVKDLVVAIDGLKGASFTQVLAGLPGVIASLTGLLGTIFGDSAADRERKQILRDNTNRLRELTEVTGDLVDARSPGRTIAGVGSVLGSFLSSTDFGELFGNNPKDFGKNVENLLDSALRKSGLSLADLDEVAKDLRIQIRRKDGTLDLNALSKLLTAIQSADTGAPGTFKGRLRTLDTGLQIGAVGKDQEFGKLLGISGDNAITRLLKDFDPNDRAGGIAKLQQLFADLAAGKLSLGDLGDLSRSEFEDLIVRLIGILQSDQSISPFTLPTGTPNAGGVPSASVGLDTLNDLTVESNTYLADILATLQTFRPAAPPALPVGFGAAGTISAGGLTITGPINLAVNVPEGAPPTDPSVVRELADSLMEEIDQRLALRLFSARAAGGDVAR